MSLDDRINVVKEAIYYLEGILIQQHKFLDNNNQPIFISNVEIQKSTGFPENDVIDAINRLDQNEFIIFNNIFGIAPDQNIKFLIRSRIYHIIWVLYKSTNRTRYRIEYNVGDYQYLRYIKRRPKLSRNLENIFDDQEIQNILNYPKNNLITKVISQIKRESNFKLMSNFQINSSISILKNLETRNNPSGLVIVAGTGAGKSFAYQFPLLLWILNKKINKYNDLLKEKIEEKDLHVNCSALLIFPRNALAQDQLEYLTELIDIINEEIERFPDARGKQFLKIKKPLPDFQNRISSRLESKYGNSEKDGHPDIIITNPQSLERRILNPECNPVYRNGIDCILYDEVHLWDGIEGAQIASLNARLQNLLQERSKPPLFVGMSATIDRPDWHCQKLFSLLKQKRPTLIIQDENDDDTVKFSIEHHLILKPRSGRSPIGVAIDTTSCLIHNRRDGLTREHDDNHNPSLIDRENKPKSLTFIDSLNQTGSFTNKLNNFEYFWSGKALHSRNANSQRPNRTYLFHYRPQQRLPTNNDCAQCVNRTSPDIFRCPSYIRGECWYYSSDDGNQHANVPYGNWHQFVPGDRLTMPRDNIRSDRVTSLDDKNIQDKYDYFVFDKSIWLPDGLQPAYHALYSDIDNVVATSTLEVGVDFKMIKEIIQFGEIRSPSSYKQKAGRGAREGNSEDGLFVMSVITDSPLSYYHFKHFSRLVKSSLDPLKLEITNPNIVKSNCFFSIFDFFALNGINLFKISNLNRKEVELEYNKAFKLLTENKLKNFLQKFLIQFDITDSTFVDEVINDVTNFLEILSTKKTIKINSTTEQYTVHEWLIKSVDSVNILQTIRSQLGIDVIQKRQKEFVKINDAIEKLNDAYKKYFPEDDSIEKKLNELMVELYD